MCFRDKKIVHSRNFLGKNANRSLEFYKNCKNVQKVDTPSEARTHNRRMAQVLLHKYGALANCATGVPLEGEVF